MVVAQAAVEVWDSAGPLTATPQMPSRPAAGAAHPTCRSQNTHGRRWAAGTAPLPCARPQAAPPPRRAGSPADTASVRPCLCWSAPPWCRSLRSGTQHFDLPLLAARARCLRAAALRPTPGA
eukprot:3344396-Prymnesium_polylepis.1